MIFGVLNIIFYFLFSSQYISFRWQLEYWVELTLPIKFRKRVATLCFYNQSDTTYNSKYKRETKRDKARDNARDKERETKRDKERETKRETKR